MPARLIDSLATSERFADLFSDESVLQAMLDFERALARAEARAGLIPKSAAEAISRAAKHEEYDLRALAAATLRAGTPGIPLAKALAERVGKLNSGAARFVHWGATSQDVADTALVLLLKRARPVFVADLSRIEKALRAISETHKRTVMLGRTLMQPAPPVTFGLKAAGWLGAVVRSRVGLERAFDGALILQLGGASGTLSALGRDGLEIAQGVAKELGLGLPDAPWHTHRDRLAALLCACGVMTGSLGKIARDIGLLMQSEVGEAAEAAGNGRGGSSTMPHKTNPIGCALTLAAANRVPGEVAAFLAGMIQEHERGIGGWQAEWRVISSVVQAAGVAAESMAEVLEGLTVDPVRMRANLEGTHGTIFAERARMLLAAAVGRDAAHQLLEFATRKSLKQGRHLSEVLGEMPEVVRYLDSRTLKNLEIPEQYLGAAEIFRKRLLAASRKSKRKKEQ